jgi:hypothetical protein
MRYTVDFEVGSDLTYNVAETVYKALVSALGRINRFRIVQSSCTYVGYVQGNRPVIWTEVHTERPPDQ